MKRTSQRSSQERRVALYPGTFDPITSGHMDLIRRGLKIFDRIIIAVASDHAKHPIFTLSERIDLIRKTMAGTRRIEVEAFDGLVVDFALRKGAGVLLRGVRMLTDFEFEFQMALTNRKLNPRVETVFLMPNESYAYLTSRLIKEVASLGGDVRRYVPPYVYRCLRKKLSGVV